MTSIIRKTAFIATLLTGALLVFIGTRFFIDPRNAETGFGIHVSTTNDFSFHYIKGIRDLFSGLIILILLFAKEWRALGLLMLTATIVPSVDYAIVWNTPGHLTVSLFAHLTAIILALVLGSYYTFFSSSKTTAHAL
jgi:predicted exporter